MCSKHASNRPWKRVGLSLPKFGALSHLVKEGER